MSGETHFTADEHFFHNRVAEIRGFATTAEHNEALCEAWVKHVRPRDSVFVLGDVAVANVTGALALIKKLPGRKCLIAGNHDGCHPMHQRSPGMTRRYLDEGGFASVQMAGRRKIAGRDVLLSHFPYHRDHTEQPRHAQWRLRDLGEWLAHGHIHSSEKLTSDHEIHVGVDAWGWAPVSSAQIAELMRTAA